MNIHKFSTTAVLLVLLIAVACTQKKATGEDSAQKVEPNKSVRPTHWGYEGEDGPEHWGALDPVYADCAEGMHQSPINIATSELTEGINYDLNYKPIPSFHIAHNEHMEEIIDNGHTIQVTVDEGSDITIEGKVYTLKQFHFHTPSEHTIDGEHYPMEMHMVHQSTDDQLAVVSLMIAEGDPNANFDKIIAHIPDTKSEAKHVDDTDLDINQSLPSDIYAYHYVGSLTTPPCSENVQWLVLKELLSLSSEQIHAFSSKIGDNNRPVQAVNDREVKVNDLVLEVN